MENLNTKKEKIKNFQECSHLEIEDNYSTSTNTLADLMMLQKEIQENVYGYDFKQLQSNMKELVDFWKWNQLAIQSEIMEAFDALGGIKDGVGSASWKPWKKENKNMINKSLSNLSDGDLKELKMELIDIQHFLFNLMLSVGMTPQEVFNYYYSKNKENIERQKRGY